MLKRDDQCTSSWPEDTSSKASSFLGFRGAPGQTKHPPKVKQSTTEGTVLSIICCSSAVGLLVSTHQCCRDLQIYSGRISTSFVWVKAQGAFFRLSGLITLECVCLHGFSLDTRASSMSSSVTHLWPVQAVASHPATAGMSSSWTG